MKTQKIFLSLLIAAVFCGNSFSSVREGTIINVNPSVRASGMGYANVANKVDDVFGFFSNPAYKSDYPMAGLMYSTLFKDGESFSEEASGALAFIYPELFFGINAGVAAVSSIEGNIGNEQDIAAYLNLSKKVKFLSFGTNVKYIDSKYYSDTDSGSVAADFGILADFGNISAGLSGYNLLGNFSDISGEKIEPSLSAGISVDFFIENAMLIIEVDAIQKNIDDDKIIPRAGIEVFYSFFALRGGYEYDEDMEENGILSAGFGLDVKNFLLDYSYTSNGNKDYGKMHKAALSYRFHITPNVNNEQYKQQVKLEKQQAKQQEKLQKERAKIQEEQQERQSKLDEKKAAKGTNLPLQPINYDQDENEFLAFLAPVEMENSVSSRLTSVKDEKTYHKATETKKGDFDAAAYLLELGRTNGTGQENSKVMEARQHFFQATPFSEDDYDPAKELLAQAEISDSARQTGGSNKKPELKIVPDEENVKKKTKTQKAKNAHPEKTKTASASADVKKQKKIKTARVQQHKDEDEFDAARYILENPGQSKIKQYYVKPTETAKDEFDAALYLIQMEKEKPQTP